MPIDVPVATFAVRRNVSPDWRHSKAFRVQRMLLVPEDGSGGAVYIPFSPNAINHDNIGADWARVSRPGRVPVLIHLNEQLPTMSFELFVADKSIRRLYSGSSNQPLQTQESAMTTISTLRSYARLGTRLRVTYGALESGIWRITNFSTSSDRRDPHTNEITSAGISIEMTRVSDVVVGLGPVTGGVQPPPTNTPPSTPQGRTHTVKKGDTLWAISIKYYGTGSKWKKIADANGIKDPRKLKIGKVLRIP